VALSTDVAQTYRTRELIEELLADPRQLGPDYAPIHSLADGKLVGYKATGRGAVGTALADTLSLLDGARSLGLVERLDWAFRALAVEDLLPLNGLELHLTPEPETFGTPCPPRLAGVLGRARRDLAMAAEVHAEAFEPGVNLEAGLTEVKEWGWKVVLADMVEHPELHARAAEIRPDVVQIDLRCPSREVSDEDHGVRQACELATRTGAMVMALGVDTPSLRERAIALGAAFARGDLYGVPGPLPAS
jgi:EAL domain-containing protein (putative c-di-GMP-specific phosphodiesterase class I)